MKIVITHQPHNSLGPSPPRATTSPPTSSSPVYTTTFFPLQDANDQLITAEGCADDQKFYFHHGWQDRRVRRLRYGLPALSQPSPQEWEAAWGVPDLTN